MENFSGVLIAGSSLAIAPNMKKKESRCKDGESKQIANYKLAKGENLEIQIKASLTGNPADAKSGTDLAAASLIGRREEPNA